MDLMDHRLASSMKTLLIHALRSEAGLIKQFYPHISVPQASSSLDLKFLNDDFDILRTGVGLKRCNSVLQKIVDPERYSRVIHFGVSGSLSHELKINQLVEGYQFIAADKPTITFSKTNLHDFEQVPAVSFISSDKAITSDISRLQAVGLGGQAVDMESYAVAHFCVEHNLDLLALRCISDQAGDTTEADFKQHYSKAAATLQTFLMKHVLAGPKI